MEYLSQNTSLGATPINKCDNFFTVAKINLILTALGLVKNNASRGPNVRNNPSRGPNVTNNSRSSINRNETCKSSSRDAPSSASSSASGYGPIRSKKYAETNENLVGAITHSEKSYRKF